MDNIVIIAIILTMVVVLLMSGLYIHSVLFAAGIIGLIMLEGFNYLPGLLGNESFRRVASYTLTTIPLFVLMAQFILQAGIVRDVFYLVNKAARGRNSVLGILTLSIGGVLGAVSGSGTATSASLGQVAIPELRKHGYSGRLAGAIAASGGSLSGIIPPSIILILYGVATETPVGALFIGAIIPGIIVLLVFITVMLVFYQVEKKRSSQAELPDEEGQLEVHGNQQVNLLRLFVVSFAATMIMLVIFGGIYSGLFTPTEAGGVGAFVAFLAAVCLGKVNFQFLQQSLVETIKLTGMVMLIMIGAQIFGRFVSLSLLPRKLIDLLEPIMEQPAIVLILISLFLFVLFMFIEGAAVILMTIPVLLPIMNALQVDLLWFGVFVGIICTIGLITPPVGLSVYAVSGVSKIRSEAIFKVCMIFALSALAIVCGLMILFPEIATFLPSSMD
ncbi:TRAP transporter large permease [Alkalibacillus aidingensis]|uniref:TRAP transporter large permease n=1 Tax=Alkalibacillus aidingensis TaxID=2747607 RepID=UPI0016607834|nr:TRAP transporter large permease [Alkalibacillus aidingensis]